MLKERAAPEIGQRLRDLRGDQNQRTLASRLQVSQQAISNYEQGNVPDSWEFLRRLSREWNVNLHWLLDGQGPRELRGGGSSLAALSDNRAPDWPRAFLDQMVFEETDTLDLLLHYYFLYLVAEPADVKAHLMGDLQRLVEASRTRLEGSGAPAQEREILGSAHDALARDDRRAMFDALLRAGERREALELKRSLPGARRLYLAALSLARSQGWRTEELESARRIGRSYRKEGRWDDADFFFQIAIATFEDESLPWSNGSRRRRAEGEVPALEPRAPHDAASTVRGANGGSVTGVPAAAKARTLLGYGHLAREQGDIAEARSRYLSALRWALESTEASLRAEVYLDLACLSYREKDFRKAGEFMATGRTFAEGLENDKLRSQFDLADALVLRELGRLEDAEAILIRLMAATEDNDLDFFSLASLNLAEVLADQGRTDEAAELLRSTAAPAEKHGNPRNLALRMLLQARLAVARGDETSAGACVLDCIRFARDHGLTAEFERAAAFWTSRQLTVERSVRAV